MLHGIRGYDNVTDIDVSVQGTGNACVDDSVNLKHTDQDLRAGSGVYFADTAFHNDNVRLERFPSGQRCFSNDSILLLAQLNHELSAGDKSVHPASLNLEIPPVFLRFRSLSGTISHPASEFTIQLGEQ